MLLKHIRTLRIIIKSGGFVRCGWDGSEKTEAKIKDETKATIRCVPFDENPEKLEMYLFWEACSARSDLCKSLLIQMGQHDH